MMTSTVIIVGSPTKTYAENLLAKEYFLKAAFLYNFARLVDWPDNKFHSSSTPFRLCLIGDDPFDKALRSIRNKTIQGRPLIIRRLINLSEASQCEILFISQSEKDNLPEILNYVRQSPILTVSELPDFAQTGGHIRFFLSGEKKLKLEINRDSITHSDLKISSRILTLANLVKTEGKTKATSGGSSKETVKP